MRVETYNQVAQIYQSGKLGKAGRAHDTAAGRDEVTISRAGYDYQVARQAVAEDSGIREEKVAWLKAKVESGSYKVEAGDFAGRLIEKYKAMQK